ncbi:vitamin D3 hydroxylase-associated protein-like isoform X3 [Acanthochromis polyacanthus]|uniref:vitamin D3 hydroxylase-associated protein-like isoform X3 n=1 Tax=Acanthochromis polyacanthus TaxID=80966 RepID=UPI002234E286|nr:vitamin D3 hydroxylase-associated protein-like isoform X3 [Acanthochromis polyacanthus]
MDYWTATLLTVVAGVGTFLLLRRRVGGGQEAKEKILRARNRRTESLRRAEEAVIRYKQSHQTTNLAPILELSLSQLTKQLHEGSLDPKDVFHSYVEKTLAVHKKLNCCTEILLESFDQLETVGSNKEGLLYGVPVSIKDNCGYKGHDSSCGVLLYLEKPVQEDSVLVQVLKKQGAIPFVKTNIPQGLLSYDCSNPIYGQTVNPHNLQKTSGGSSGGEGALIGGGGALLGIGSDIGGSIRIPASFCGICGFKPTSGRLSLQGLRSTCPGQKSVRASPGPMARDVDSIVLCMQALLCDHMFSLDPTVPPLPFNMQIYQSTKPLRIGYLENNGFQQPSPSMVRSVREVRALLEQAGHTFVPYQPLRIKETFYELLFKGTYADGAATLAKNMAGSPIDPTMKRAFPHTLPLRLRRIFSFLLEPWQPRTSLTLRARCGVGSIPELWEQHAAVEDYIKETIAHWRKCDIDVLLCPVIAPAYNFFYTGKNTAMLSYTWLYNLLNFPAGVVPVTTVTKEDEEELKHYQGIYQDEYDKFFKEAVTGAEGLPVAVQCVALPWQEELCLRFMKEVEQLVKQSRK